MAQKFLIDRDLGDFCIPFKVSSASTVPKSGKLSFYSGFDVRHITKVDISTFDLNNNNILRYLTGSSKGNILIHSKELPTSYAVFSYYTVTENTNYISLQLESGIYSGSIAFSEHLPFSKEDEVCIVLDYNDGAGGGGVVLMERQVLVVHRVLLVLQVMVPLVLQELLV